jgi:hypothetical protein
MLNIAAPKLLPIAKLGELDIAPVAQLDRASVYGTEGREFESLRAHGFTLWRGGRAVECDGLENR